LFMPLAIRPSWYPLVVLAEKATPSPYVSP
jgi:hypothetical protein